ncbi:MAG: M24 family metallopeptidase [Planctomycetota bacterium]|jgi:Xaa-Pro aminopeptidase
MIDEEKWKGVCTSMGEAGFDFALIVDREGGRNANLTYLTNHPYDAWLLLSASGERVLFPWDVKLARERTRNVEVVDAHWTGGGVRSAVMKRLGELAGRKDFTLAFPSRTAYHTVKTLGDGFPEARIEAEPSGLDRILQDARSVKTKEEIAILEEGFAIADEVIGLIPEWLEGQRGKNPREIDLAVHLQREMFDRGTDGARKAMLVANADRSAQVHPDPQAGESPLFKPGLALIDFWMVHKGYHTDLTIPLLFEPLSSGQERMIEVVTGVYDEAMASLVTGASIGRIARRARDVFDEAGLRPVGGLGHGLGLSGHDPPPLLPLPQGAKARETFVDRTLEEGMVLAIEPGVIHDELGGFRLENDVVIGPERGEIKTHAQAIRIPSH